MRAGQPCLCCPLRKGNDAEIARLLQANGKALGKEAVKRMRIDAMVNAMRNRAFSCVEDRAVACRAAEEFARGLLA